MFLLLLLLSIINDDDCSVRMISVSGEMADNFRELVSPLISTLLIHSDRVIHRDETTGLSVWQRLSLSSDDVT